MILNPESFIKPGIDILIKKDDIYTLIQCKNYAEQQR